ncbi:MAG: hypothetical protein L0Y44_06440 [Phycisphaerales bacterium]|nr:hypothetical protein [Phycisphaerales bacterium]
MKRRVIPILLFLMAGAIINVAVAWGCSYFVIPPFRKCVVMTSEEFGVESAFPVADRVSAVDVWIGFGLSEMTARNWTRDRDEARAASLLVPTSEGDRVAAIVSRQWAFVLGTQEFGGPRKLRVDAGWPLHSFTGYASVVPFSYLVNRRGVTIRQKAIGAIAVERTVRGQPLQRLFPFKPIGVGAAFNTVFYAAIVRLLFAAPGFFRRRMRIKRGLCPACAYPVGAGETCTECGKPVRTA